jgi:hypothetical protein
MSPVTERDFPKGHPKAADYDPKSPEAIEWARVNIHPMGERAYPVDSKKSSDTPGHECSLEWRAGVDPLHPELEPHTGATPEVAAARRAAYLAQQPKAQETPTLPEGFVDTGKVAEDAAVLFVVAQGHNEEEARKIVREQGVDRILAAKATLGKGE